LDSIIKEKIRKVGNILQGKKILVAFSGGVDSSVITRLAKEFGSRVLAITVKSRTNPPGEIEEAQLVARELGVEWRIVEINELENSDFQANPPDRCYYCKKELMTELRKVAEAEGLDYIVDGTNADDLKDFRPGGLALQELDIKSPLAEAGITKEEIRSIAKVYNLSVHDKPSMACLSSRIPYGEKITENKLEMIAKAEIIIRRIIGSKVVRVRHHGSIARIEVHPDERAKFFDKNLLDQIVSELKKLGYIYVTLDLQGYRSGAMNELL
jgi:uncharacterized protein